MRSAPVSDFKIKNIITAVPKDFILDLEEVIDVPNPALGKWYKDSNNHYYNEMGLMPYEEVIQPIVSKKFEFNPTIDNWWITDYGIDKIWEETRGAGVKIAIIDSGLDFNHTNIKHKNNIQYFDIITNSSNRDDCLPGNYYHGTKCAGIISAHGPDIFGIAPEADLLIIKATVNGNLNADKMILAIKKAIELKSDIISISYDYDILITHPLYNELLEAVKEAANNNILVVASVGNDTTTNPITERYPASFTYSLSVGSVNKNKNLSNFTLNENIDVLAPGEDMEVLTANDTTHKDSGTSFSTPFVAGICALYISKTKNKNIDFLRNTLKTDSLLKEEIRTEALKYTTINIPNLGVINPKKLFNI